MSSKVLQLKPSEVYEFITAALTMKRVPYIAGPGAIGKSSIVHQVAEDANAYMIDMRLSQRLSEDLTGLPERDADKGKAVYLPFDDFPLEGDKIPDGYSGWLLFLDELSSASEEVLAAAYSLLLDRTVGGKKLHDKCLIVAAGNRASDSAIARELPDTIITRVMPAEMRTNHKDWINWAEQDPRGHEAVISFVNRYPNMLYEHNKAGKRDDELESYAQPRGWGTAFEIMHFHDKEVAKRHAEKGEGEITIYDDAGIPRGKTSQPAGEPLTPLVFSLFCSAVGPSAARAFRDDYDEAIKLPYPWEVAQSPGSTRIPNSHIGKAKLITELSKHFLESDDQTRDGLLQYVNRIGGEYSELMLKQIKDGLGDTNTDKLLIDRTSKRLSIDPLLGTAPKGGNSPEENIPF